jgi:hypothetical protein
LRTQPTSPAEKNDILWLPPPDVENQLHQSTFNVSSRAALVAKALPDDGAQLTLPEAKWLARIGRIDPFVEDGPIGVVERAERRFRTPIADRDLLDQAQAAVLTADEKTAKLHGEHQDDRLREERKRVKEQNRERFRELAQQQKAEWVQAILDAGLPRWGFVLLRTAYASDAGDSDGDGERCSDAA